MFLIGHMSFLFGLKENIKKPYITVMFFFIWVSKMQFLPLQSCFSLLGQIMFYITSMFYFLWFISNEAMTYISSMFIFISVKKWSHVLQLHQCFSYLSKKSHPCLILQPCLVFGSGEYEASAEKNPYICDEKMTKFTVSM